jgi:phosphoribosyl-AMP cyclohydrolase
MIEMAGLAELRWDENGLVPAVVQDGHTGQVLMVAWMDDAALRLTLETGETHFWSRSRRALWHKGETSGNVQRVTGLWLDCDGDTLLVQVEPAGPACHTGAVSCFYRELREAREGEGA